ncbi:hypothetical protein Mp_4g23330 [Marchantia polymorpha subsp. ruderalis]|uniref:MULE transposase domain-containing protein n=2 Tax=Marchantia polymorpha TaxID=3197 RepID=A0AAF6BCX8_MARPO|nr:hypothetical protein MARPO_0020s0096 [Marchantia polymorpha]BBN09862.1 hypothetical protein Mp_4g23330 [Marchantia polymorpha subsp. ruderalis]|eukprot:PTQ44439.1 hypothetical protein MARPO_0020s0096 [Marchantia polymorpha]
MCTFCVVLQRFVTEPDAENVLGKTEWRLELENGEHNHPAATDISAYPAARRLKGDEQQTIWEISDAGADPKVILATVRQRNPKCELIVKDIYNHKAQLRNVNLNGRTPLEKLLDDMQSDGVLHVYERDAEGRITRLFFALPLCVALAREFYHVLLMDATYKTNKFKMPLLHAVSLSSTSQTFSAAFCFLRSETEADYTWALTQIKSIFDGDHLPKVIVTDCDQALMSALATVFPNAHNLLCVQRDFPPKVCDYLKNTWIVHKERFVHAWTRNHRHLNNLVTSRAEGKHASLKSWHRLAVEHQEKAIRQRIAYERANTLIAHRNDIWADVRRKVSHFALKEVEKQVQKARHFGDVVKPCTETFQRTMGLPCAHAVRDILATPPGRFQMEHFFEHWWLDRPAPAAAGNGTRDLVAVMENVAARHDLLPPHQQRLLQDQLEVLSQEQVTAPVQDPPMRRPRGRPRGARGRRAPADNSTRRDPSAFERVPN